ncbi:MAG: lipid-A-disaccharide synthase [Gammaproteobacteria bacterium]|nr:lipid-A-disaccharide synthase [Gammaproteobacteria bacterium]
MLKIVIIAGEASGDALAGGLIRELRRIYPEASFAGVTGSSMRREGCESWGDIEQLAVMGLLEVIRHLPRIRRLKRAIEDRLRADPPDILIGVDAPDFNLRIEKHARSLGIRTVQYVCPSVWAWRSGRVKTIREACDHVLCLLPIEPGFLEEHGIEATFVGHPLADQIAGDNDKSASRHALGLQDGPIVALLPGSRRAEIERLGRVFLQAAEQVRENDASVSFVVAAASPKIARLIEAQCEGSKLGDSLRVVSSRTREVISAADTVLVTSGTATLETMLLHRPMVVAYRFAPFTAWFLKSFMLNIERFSLPNILANDDLVPEYLQGEASAPALGAAVLEQLRDETGCNRMVARFRELADQMRCSADERAAAAIANVLTDKAE